MRPDIRRGGPEIATQGRLDTTFTDKAIVAGTAPVGRAPRSGALVLPLANGSQAAPYPGKVLWRVMYQCSACNHTHLAYSREEISTGKRRAPCGARVWLVVRRVYRGGQAVA